MQQRTEEGDPMLKFRCSIVAHLNTESITNYYRTINLCHAPYTIHHAPFFSFYILITAICVIHCVPKKVSHLMFDNIFGKCRSIFKILSPGDSQENFLCTHHKDFHLTCNVLLHCLVKVKNPKMLLTLTAPQQTVDMFLRTL